MSNFGQLIPTEEEEANEGRLKEEGHQPFDCERCAEDIADVVAVIGPIHAELELHRDAGRYPHREVDSEKKTPEFRHPPPDVASGHHVNALHHPQKHGQSECQRHEEKVIHRGQTELQPRELNDIESGGHGGRIPGWRALSAPDINRNSTFPPSIFRRCPVANTAIAAAITTVSLMASTMKTSRVRGCVGIPHVSGAERRGALI